MGRLVTLVNDVGLLSEEYDPRRERQMGNVPQALSHLTLVRAADAIAAAERGREDRLPYVRGESEGEQAEVTEQEPGGSPSPPQKLDKGADQDLGSKPRQARADAAGSTAGGGGRAAELPALRAQRARRILLERELRPSARPRSPARRCASTLPPCRRARTAGGRRPGCRGAPARTEAGRRGPSSRRACCARG